MKNFLALFVLFFIANSVFAQIRLDSIIAVDPATQEISDAFRFGYDGELTTYYEEVGISLDIEHNANGDFDTWSFQSDYGENEIRFVYDSQNNLDSIITSANEYGYLYEQFYDLTYVDGKLVEVDQTDVEDGYSYAVESREYFYTNDELDSIALYDSYYGDEFYGSYTYKYDAEGKIQEIRMNDLSGKLEQKWVTAFSGDQIQTLSRFDYFTDTVDVLARIYQYDHKSNIPFAEIQTPKDVFEIIEIIAVNEYSEFLIPFRYSTQIDIIEQQSFGEFTDEYFYYYSSTVGTDNERIVMTPITVSPNPTSDYINIEVDDEISSVSIMSLNGQLISQQTSTSKAVDVRNLVNGQYTVIVELENGSHVFSQFVKQ